MYKLKKPESFLRSSSFYKSFPSKKLVLWKLWNSISNYSETFSSTFYTHLKSEFEVKIRDGKIAFDGNLVLDKLKEDFKILQYKENLEAIFLVSKSFCQSEVARSV